MRGMGRVYKHCNIHTCSRNERGNRLHRIVTHCKLIANRIVVILIAEAGRLPRGREVIRRVTSDVRNIGSVIRGIGSEGAGIVVKSIAQIL